MKDKVEFSQKVKILKEDLKVRATCEYQVCTTVDGKCIPGEEKFMFEDINITFEAQVTDRYN